MKLSKRTKKIMIAAVSVIVLAFLCSLTAFADGEVAGAVESTWNAAKGQIKTIVNNVVFPVVDVILAILLFVKIATSYMDYRKHGQFEWTAPAILFGCLIFDCTAVFMEYCGTLRKGCKYAVYSIHRGGKAACEQRGLDRISPHEGREIRESWARIQADLL